jgi:hypothetical protein
VFRLAPPLETAAARSPAAGDVVLRTGNQACSTLTHSAPEIEDADPVVDFPRPRACSLESTGKLTKTFPKTSLCGGATLSRKLLSLGENPLLLPLRQCCAAHQCNMLRVRFRVFERYNFKVKCFVVIG